MSKKPQVAYSETPVCIQDLLISSVGCGNEQLEAELRSKVHIIVGMYNGCNALNDYLLGQAALIEHAMAFTRGMIDIARTRSRSLSTQLYVSKNRSESQAQRVSQGKNCQFSDTSSFQQFRRDDIQSSRSQSQTDSYAHGETWTQSWNLGRTWASGYSNINDWSYSTTVGDGHGEHDSVTATYGQSFTRTNENPAPQKNDIDPGIIGPLTVIGDLLSEVLELLTGWEINVNWSGILTGSSGGVFSFEEPDGVSFESAFDDPVNNNFRNPGCTFPVDSFPTLSCCCNDRDELPDCPDDQDEDCDWMTDYTLTWTYGRGYNVNYNLTVNVPVLGDAVTVNWSNGENFNQRHIISKMCSNASMLARTENLYEQTDFAETWGRGRTHDENHARNDAHVISRSQRDSFSDTIAGSATTGDARSTSESGSDQKAHGEASSTGQGTRHSTSLSTSKTTNRGMAESKSEVTKWSQVFRQLHELWSTIMQEIYHNRLIASQSVPAAIGRLEDCAFSVPSDPIINSKVRALNSINQGYLS